jgi:hypothetical protein
VCQRPSRAGQPGIVPAKCLIHKHFERSVCLTRFGALVSLFH